MSVDEEVFKVRDRVHKLADVVQSHEGALAKYGVQIATLEKQVDNLTNRTASRDQLDTAMATITIKLTSAVDLLTEKIRNVEEGLSPIRKALYWAVGLLAAAFFAALWALIVRGHT